MTDQRVAPQKPVLCLDFDGVIHSCESGWQGAEIVGDMPVRGAFEFILDALQHFRVAIFSSRSNQPGGMEAMRGWFALHALAEIGEQDDAYWVIEEVEWVTEKPAAFVTLDDRAITFMGKWPSIEMLKNFKTWQQLKEGESVEWLAMPIEFHSYHAGEPDGWDYSTGYRDLLNRLGVNGHEGAIAEIDALRRRSGLDRPGGIQDWANAGHEAVLPTASATITNEEKGQ